jgi:hypothetical protein
VLSSGTGAKIEYVNNTISPPQSPENLSTRITMSFFFLKKKRIDNTQNGMETKNTYNKRSKKKK